MYVTVISDDPACLCHALYLFLILLGGHHDLCPDDDHGHLNVSDFADDYFRRDDVSLAYPYRHGRVRVVEAIAVSLKTLNQNQALSLYALFDAPLCFPKYRII